MDSSHGTIQTTAELDACWRRLIEPLGFGSRQLFVLLLDRHGKVDRSIINIAECPRRPDRRMVRRLLDRLHEALDDVDPAGSCAMLWARPTTGGTRSTDLEWVLALNRAADRAGIRRWSMFVADDHVLNIVAPDDLAA